MTVQFSGGEPTMSPHFLEACRYAKDVGYFSVQAATNGLRFALEPEFAHQAKEAGFDLAYFQFDGVTNNANGHRHISNLFDVKQQAIDVMYEAGIDIIPVTTVVNGVNDDQVGPILDFVIKNSDRMGGVSFQPVSFTGRDEEISDEDRRRQRYTISHMAHELERYTGGKDGRLPRLVPTRRDGRPRACSPTTCVAAGPGGAEHGQPRLLVPPQLRVEHPARREPQDEGVVDDHPVLRHGRLHAATSPSSATARAAGS